MVARRPLTTTALAMGVGILVTVAPVLPATAASTTASTTAPSGTFSDGGYVVTLAQDPIAEYDGSVPGIPRLKSAGGQLDMTQSTTRRYRDLLLSAQSKVADAVGAVPQQRYTVALNGFSARLTGAQAQKLAGTAGVVSVAPDVTRHLADTTTESRDRTQGPATTLAAAAGGAAAGAPARTTADDLGLTGQDGVWDRLGGVANVGRGVVVADLDTGLWPEHPSVAGSTLPAQAPAGDPHGAYRSGSTIRMAKADGGTYTGVCEIGERWSASNCSTKVVGARSFNQGFLDVHALAPEEFDSVRDSDGHGTHTGTTAVGRNGVPATIQGDSYGDVTGIAPAAALAVYKVCWTSDEGDNGCQTSDLVAAIDQAVADNVDVINYSIGSDPSPDPADPVETAFLVAASAGVFVSASAGNSGPGASTVDHQSPWVTTVASATSVLREGTVVLGDGTKLVGARLQQKPLPAAPIVLGSAVRVRKAPAGDADKCLDGSLDPARAKGKVVVCERAITARVAKSAEVARAGGVGMVLYNPVPNSLEPDAHSVPTVHLDTRAGEKVLAYVRGHRNPTVAFQRGNTTGRPTATPQISAFSSRGPALVDDGDVLKPDVTAPGSGVVAGYSPVASTNGRDLFAPESGTSMSAPHVSGLAALYVAAHPEFSPMMVKSALMTTARDIVGSNGKAVRKVLSAGAGFVDPTRMFAPGLVYDSAPLDWLRWLEGSGVDTGTGLGAVDPSDLNQASIAVGDLVGSRTVTRSVTAVTGGFYYATADVPGFDVQVQPSVLNLQPGQTGQFRVTFTRTTAPADQWSSGWLTWTGGDRLTVRSPVALKPLTLGGAPADLAAPAAASGAVTATVLPGTSGPLAVRSAGLVAGDTRSGRVPVGDVREFPVTIPEGTTQTRFDLLGQAGSDLDLYLYTDGGTLVAQSATSAGDERIDGFTEPGRYVLQVSGYAGAPGASDAEYSVTSFVLGSGRGVGDFTVTPDPLPLQQGRPTTLTASWKGLDPSRRYLGTIAYGDTPLRTVVAVG